MQLDGQFGAGRSIHVHVLLRENDCHLGTHAAVLSQGFEHAVVNMFLIPVGMLLGANISVSSWWLWNQIPVTLGNLVGGMLFTGLAIYTTHRVMTPAAVEATATHATQPNARTDQRGYSPSF